MIILKQLFNATVKYHNTKQLPLISTGAVLYSEEIHQYLYGIDKSLNIYEWINEYNSQQHQRYESHSKIIMQRIQSQLSCLVNSKKDCKKLITSSNLPTTTMRQSQIADNCRNQNPFQFNNHCHPTYANPINLSRSQNIPKYIKITNVVHLNNNYHQNVHIPTGYGAVHGVQFAVQHVRYHPIMVIPNHYLPNNTQFVLFK